MDEDFFDLMVSSIPTTTKGQLETLDVALGMEMQKRNLTRALPPTTFATAPSLTATPTFAGWVDMVPRNAGPADQFIAAHKLTPGTPVRFNDHVRPLYLQGIIGHVSSMPIRPGGRTKIRVNVRLPQKTGRFSGEVGVPVTCLMVGNP